MHRRSFRFTLALLAVACDRDFHTAPEGAGDATAAWRSGGFGVPARDDVQINEGLEAQRERLVAVLQQDLGITSEQAARVWQVFATSPVLGQGNPLISQHPLSEAACTRALLERPLRPADAICGSPYMVAVYDPAHERQQDARVCIDQFEFPGVPCQYPVVHVTAREAVSLCEAVGKRICDAHEWEGACAGSLRPAAEEYAWGSDRATMRALHNREREIVWAYGTHKDHGRCATTSEKTPGCPGSGFRVCGSNTFPTGAFPECVSPFGAYDLHGNVAEHMNLPMTPDELSSAGGHGRTEMKGSWFIFSHTEAHPDDCRWRAPDWHGSRILDPRSHGNYHLGFRCCKAIAS
jgi:sulfatase-modifying factor enzyme 1